MTDIRQYKRENIPKNGPHWDLGDSFDNIDIETHRRCDQSHRPHRRQREYGRSEDGQHHGTQAIR